ncbi:MAG TPA: NifU family protein [Erysipelothrix sp.]|jgi:Fe-S cluster biogenesis protein NfuA|nr:NifU family protein [Erysipelothrix sp.]
MTLEEKVIYTLNKIRPYIQGDGGDVAFDRIDDDGVVYVNLLGACVGCGLADVTVKMGIEAILMDEIPEVTEVRVVE